MQYDHCSVAREGAVTIVTIAREHAHNALHADAHLELEAIFDDFAQDDDQWIAIITGAGEKAFCAGHDMRVSPTLTREMLPRSGFGGLTHRFDCAKPIIAAVNGTAMGGGFEIALACDIVIAHERAVFALPEPRVGLAALAGGLQRLTLEIGLKRAMALLLTGKRCTAGEGFALGFVNEVVSDSALEGAKRWAATMLECSPIAVRATKQAAHEAIDRLLLRDVLEEEWSFTAMITMLGSADAAEGTRAFAEKRTPRWLGR